MATPEGALKPVMVAVTVVVDEFTRYTELVPVFVLVTYAKEESGAMAIAKGCVSPETLADTELVAVLMRDNVPATQSET